MALRLADKEAIVKEVSEVAARSISLVAAEYRGLTVSQMTKLRQEAREKGVYLRVVRNTLARHAVKGSNFENISDKLKGPLVLGFSDEEPGMAARIMKNFSKDHENLKVTAISLSGQLFGAEGLDKIAALPTKHEALGRLASVLIAPVSKLVRTMAEPHAKLVRTMAALKDKKEQE